MQQRGQPQEKFGIPRCSIVHACDKYPVRGADKVGHEDLNQGDLPELIGAVSQLDGIMVSIHVPRDYELLWSTFLSSRRANHE